MSDENKWSHLKSDPNDGFKVFDKKAREKFHELPTEKKAKSLAAKTFILFPFELKYNQDKSFEEKEQETLDMIVNHLKTHKRAYVATSFGMDSVVMMDLVIRGAKIANVPIPDMWLNDTLNTFKEEKAYWKEMIEYFGIEKQFKIFTPPKDEDGKQITVWTIAKKYGHLPSFRTIRRDRKTNKILTKEDIGGSGGGTPECCDILKKKSLKKHLKELPKDERYDLVFIGTRAEESHMRAMSILQRCRTYINKTKFPYPIRTVTPLGYWRMTDTYEYYARYNIPKNPAYTAHNMDRMGCASCPAHKNWEIRLAKDPTTEGFGMLKMNLKILRDTEQAGTERKGRLNESIITLEKYIMNKKSQTEMPEQNRTKLIAILKEFKNYSTLEDFT